MPMRPGLCVVDEAAVERFNLIDETITLATLPRDCVVAPKEMVATVKIIPFAVRADALAAVPRARQDADLPRGAVPRAPRRA